MFAEFPLLAARTKNVPTECHSRLVQQKRLETRDLPIPDAADCRLLRTEPFGLTDSGPLFSTVHTRGESRCPGGTPSVEHSRSPRPRYPSQLGQDGFFHMTPHAPSGTPCHDSTKRNFTMPSGHSLQSWHSRLPMSEDFPRRDSIVQDPHRTPPWPGCKPVPSNRLQLAGSNTRSII